MKQFLTVFKFEIRAYLKNKAYIGLTAALVLIIAAVIFFPQIKGLFSGGGDAENDKSAVVFSGVSQNDMEYMDSALGEMFPDNEIIFKDADESALKEMVLNEECDFAVLIESETSYKYIVNNMGLYDANSQMLDEIMQSKLMYSKMTELGLDPSQAEEIMSTRIESDIVQIGKNQSESFLFTYIFVFALYIAIILYGQFVASSVAQEKSTRAMELLITSAKTKNLMFGKILGVGCAGLIQIAVIFGSAFLMFNINKGEWQDNEVINSIFNMPISIILFMLLFFILGFFIYAFLFGAAGSLVSKIEDLNAAISPVMWIFIITFIIAMYSMNSGATDSALSIAASYIPLTSPMSMFIRITMGDVAAIEIIASVVILILSTLGIGLLSAKIYKMGILMYGKAPNLFSAIKSAVKKQ